MADGSGPFVGSGRIAPRLVVGAVLVGLGLLVALGASGPADAQTSCNAGTEAQLNTCITNYNASSATTTTINLTADIVVASDPVRINHAGSSKLIFQGNGRSIDGGDDPAVSNVVSMITGDLEMIDVTIKGSAGDGADLRDGPVKITGSTFTGNRRGIVASSADGVTIINSTIARNTDIGIQAGVGDPVSITLSTIARNGGFDFDDFGIANAGLLVTLSDSIVTNNSGDECDATVTNGGGNVISDTTCTGTSTTVSLATDLADNGCSTPCTQTLAPAPGSSAIDRAGACSESTDQPGNPRTVGLCDAGAVEVADCAETLNVSDATEFAYAAGCYNTLASGLSMAINLTADITFDPDSPSVRFENGLRPSVLIDGRGFTTETPITVRRSTALFRNLTVENTLTAFRVLANDTSTSVDIENSTLRNNAVGVSVDTSGEFSSTQARVVNSTFTNNLVAIQVGGGSSSVRATGVTISDNETGVKGSSFAGSDAFISLESSLIARSAVADCEGENIFSAAGAYSDASCDGTTTPGLDTGLAGVLAANGCSDCSHTLALTAGSPAIDAGGECGLATDQRGVARDATACDAGAFEFVPAVVKFCNGLAVTVDLNLGQVATPGNDVILGTPGADTINALAGNDTVCAGGGDDTVDGGAGNDTVFGEAGQDVIVGGDGDDVMHGGPDNDIIRGNTGVDTINGNDGHDRLLGGIGGDTINGEAGNDYLGGFGGDDTLNGGPGDETIFGGFGADVINGGPGNDDIFGLIGNDTINGDDGNDKLNGDRGNDIINGGNGNDVISGGNANDIANGDAGDDHVSGGKADDTLSGGSGTDTCVGNLHINGDTADATCETIFGVP